MQIQRWALDRNTPVICSYHTRFNSYLPYYFQGATLDAIDTTLWWWLVKFYRNCDHVYPPTINVQKELESKGFRNETMRIWPRGINLTSFNPSHRSTERRASWGASEETIVILMVSRMVSVCLGRMVHDTLYIAQQMRARPVPPWLLS